MLPRVLTALMLLLPAPAALSQSLDALAGKSKFIRQDLAYLKQKNAITIYTSHEARCPSMYWWSAYADQVNDARRGYTRDLTRRMQGVGFPASTTNRCLKNSGYLLKNGALQNHPKNHSYTDYVQVGLMMVREIATAKTVMSPVLFETNSYDDKAWRVFDHRLKTICTLVAHGQHGVRLTCDRYGTLNGRYNIEDRGRGQIAVDSDRYKILVVTGRTPAFVRKRFSQVFP